MSKKSILLCCLCFCTFALAGCSKGKELTEEEQDIIAEYSAGILLQHEDKYDLKLVKQEQAPEQTVEPTAAPSAVPETSKPDEVTTDTSGTEEEEPQVNEIPLNNLYHVKGMNVAYDSYIICKEYPKKSSEFQLTAKEGEKLLVVRFRVKNRTSKKLKVDLIKRKIGYAMDLDGTVYEPTIAIQENGGLNYLKTTLKPNASEEAILVYEIPGEIDNPGALVLTVQDGDNVSTIQVK